MSFICPVCAYPKLSEPPRSEFGGGSFEMCPSCGFQFGVDDDDEGWTYDKWRAKWEAAGRPWSSSMAKPKNWPPPVKEAPATPAKAEAPAKKAAAAPPAPAKAPAKAITKSAAPAKKAAEPIPAKPAAKPTAPAKEAAAPAPLKKAAAKPAKKAAAKKAQPKKTAKSK